MQVICLEEEAFYNLIEKVVERINEKEQAKVSKWVSDQDAMRMLTITSKTTLQKFRDEGKIRFSQIQPKIILYDTDSINDYIEKKAKGLV